MPEREVPSDIFTTKLNPQVYRTTIEGVLFKLPRLNPDNLRSGEGFGMCDYSVHQAPEATSQSPVEPNQKEKKKHKKKPDEDTFPPGYSPDTVSVFLRGRYEH